MHIYIYIYLLIYLYTHTYIHLIRNFDHGSLDSGAGQANCENSAVCVSNARLQQDTAYVYVNTYRYQEIDTDMYTYMYINVERGKETQKQKMKETERGRGLADALPGPLEYSKSWLICPWSWDNVHCFGYIGA